MNIKSKSVQELEELCTDIRQHIIDKVYQYGGHLSSNLGVVELTVAMHYVFDFVKDKLVLDVGHQCYAHKILTDRDLTGLRTNSGPTGFPNPVESDTDLFATGHGTTSLSLALGLARARDIKQQNHNIVTLIGDGAMGGGMAYEALNDLGASRKKVIIILNDNEMSISPNVGAMANHLRRLAHNKNFATFKNNIKRGFEVLPILGNKIVKLAKKTEYALSRELGNNVIKSLGIKYFGPYDGHNLSDIIHLLNDLKQEDGPVLIHFLTQKGKGVLHAQLDSESYHGIAAKNINLVDANTYEVESNSTNVTKSPMLYADYMSDTLIDIAKSDRSVVVIVAGMTSGTGLSKFAQTYPDRFIDVGMAEQHATTMAAGLAKGGCKPFFAVYSTFLQRGFDQVLHDVAINNLPVTFLIDRAGVNGADGVTHQGVYDIAYLNQIPKMTIMSPKDGPQLSAMLKFAHSYNAPLAIRYPKSFDKLYNTEHNIDFRWEWTRREYWDVVIVVTGNRALDIAMQCREVNVLHATFVKPLDTTMLQHITKHYKAIITIEDGVIIGGFGQQIATYASQLISPPKVVVIGHSDQHITNLDIKQALHQSGISVSAIQAIISRVKSTNNQSPITNDQLLPKQTKI
ncbi:MAG: 1-deoxy-D-xylulose-5-phosphate synthase [Clostridiales bacterium]|jgi:1-deoxy-D-xylulose-5-phosphate synthase|nr:1-deoxy-D-xylulose-5-phosphate synthase [Clostridiales bacterium]